MSEYKKQFTDYTSEYLLQLRARGDDLAAEAHHAIEEIFLERDEYLPPKPNTPIYITETQNTSKASDGNFFSIALSIIFFGVSTVLAKVLAHTWLGLFISIGVGICLLAYWFDKLSLPTADRKRDEDRNKAEMEGMNDLMVNAADGNLARVRELIDYGFEVNATSSSGATALMYATRNNHLEIVEFLLKAGANSEIRSNKKLTP